jgi:hypothetical protein
MLPRLASILPRIEGAEQTFSSLLFFQFVFNQKLQYLFFMQTSAITEISLVVFHDEKQIFIIKRKTYLTNDSEIPITFFTPSGSCSSYSFHLSGRFL